MNMLRYAEWFANRGWSSKIYCVDQSPLEKASNGKVPYSLVAINRKAFDYKNARLVAKQFDVDQLDIVWISDARDMSTVGIACKKAKCRPLLVYQQAMQLGISKRDLIHSIRFRRIDVWITLLPYLYNQISERTRMKIDRVHEIPLGIDLDRNDIVLNQSDSRASFKLPKEGCLLGVIGRYDPLKGQLFVISALRKLHDVGILAHLLLVGESTRGEGLDYEDQLVELTKELGLERFVHMRPFIQDVERFYSAVDVCVVPSSGETFGMVTIEAMASGCAVIGTNTSGTPEILGNGEYGMLYTPDDLDEFVGKAAKICKDERLRTAFGLKAAQVVREKYDLKKVMDMTEELLLHEVAKKKKS